LDRLRLFAVVAERGGFTAAAAQLGLPKSSLSRAVTSLEDDLGVRLLHRTTRRVELSTAGAALHERIRTQLAALEKATDELPERDDEPSGLLRVTTIADLGVTVLAEVVTKFVRTYPRVHVDLVFTTRVVDLVAERFDAALRVSLRPLRDSSLSARRIGRLRMHLYAAPSYLARRGSPKRAGDLASHDWVTLVGVQSVRLEGPRASVPLPVEGHIRCTEAEAVRVAIREGGGLGVLPSFLAEPDVERGALVHVMPKWLLRTGDLWFVCPSGRQIPRKVVAFRTFVVAELAKRPALSL
jgi:DNA-binding transcriptional LysR family regulator